MKIKIKINIKRQPSEMALLKLLIDEGAEVFCMGEDGVRTKVTKYEQGYQIGGEFFYGLPPTKYYVKCKANTLRDCIFLEKG